jgi:Tfp pilus assembly protein PilW
MISRLKTEEGITLVELLASIAILSIVILLVGSVHIFGQTQFISQTETAIQSNDLRYSLSLVSRDVRQAGVVEEIGEKTYMVGEYTYAFQEPNLYRNGETLSKKVQDFEIKPTENYAEIIIKSTTNRQAQGESYHTTIYFRR